ncbi:MAG TPA: aspartate 1-decarboxylase [Synergistaceae bacterium]|nr:aspartate 1-decarboxylase [Synergistaceae bacterium]HPJ26393.1 aspartate 1-decarboxylase [Synergistaceae bacterium]HPQ36432.1 aspartate 1-decarboxylase [Synergistaceae bacterium]
MQIQMLRAKLHGAVVTQANLEYDGSISIDGELMDRAGFLSGEKVLVANMASGSRFETYVIEAPSKSGTIGLNGAAARLGTPGDRVIIMAWAILPFEEAEHFRPRVVKVDSGNHPLRISEM